MATIPTTAVDPVAAAKPEPTIGDSLAHGMTIALIMTVLQRGSGLVRSFLFCGLLDDHEVGLWSLAQSLLFSLAPLSVLGITSSLRRYVEHYRVRDQLGSYLRITLGVCALTTVAMTVLLIVFAHPFSLWFFRTSDQVGLVVMIGITLSSVVLYNTLQELTESLRLLRAASWMRMVHSLGFTVLGAASILLIQADAMWVSAAFLVATIAACLPALPAIQALRGRDLVGSTVVASHDVWRKIGRYAAWNCLISLIANVFELSDRYMLLWLGGDPMVAQSLIGQYHASRMMPLLLAAVATLIANVTLPYLVTHWERGERSEVIAQLELAVKGTAIGSTFGAALVIAFAQPLYQLFFGDRYDASLGILPMTFVYCIWGGLFVVAQNYLWCCERGGWPTAALALAVAANFLANYLLIPYLGLHGAVLATLIANGVGWSLLLMVTYRLGWRASPSLLVTSLFPLVLLLGTIPSLLACVMVLATLRRGWWLNERERNVLDERLARWRRAV